VEKAKRKTWEEWASFKKDHNEKVETYVASGKVLNPALFSRSDVAPLLAHSLRDALGLPSESRDRALRALCSPTSVDGVFSIEMFTAATCEMLLNEIENFERLASENRWHTSAPNSMNNYGTILTDIGMAPWIDKLQAQVLAPVARLLFPREGAELDGHHTFTVKYAPTMDRKLDMHHDNSDVTFNISLGKVFDGAGLTFCGMLGEPRHRKKSGKIQHVPGHCIVHLGAHRHGADEIVSGERVNMIVWNTGSQFRRSKYARARVGVEELVKAGHYHKEESEPDIECISDTHDKERNGGRSWCPPKGFEHTVTAGDG
jgi:hypothetical protein